MSFSWISDNDLSEHIDRLLAAAENSIANAHGRRRRNRLDPFGSLLVAASYELTSVEGLEQVQDAESSLRGMSNALGSFHQGVLGSVNGWRDHDAGYDIEGQSRRIVAEIKNKHNTMNTTTRRGVESDLQTAVRQKGRGWKAYLVIIIPRKPERYTKQLGQDKVYEIDGASFYHIVTGQPNAMHDLFEHVCNRLSPSPEVANYCKSIMVESLPSRLA
ncbi:MAG: Eco47II family restriction endonuclease [Anaerolineaceae bacterium]|nr:Eco47II family restriction endonuclease [Anaerolineaceae bacterium]